MMKKVLSIVTIMAFLGLAFTSCETTSTLDEVVMDNQPTGDPGDGDADPDVEEPGDVGNNN